MENLKRYVREVGKIPLLTREEERKLFVRKEEGYREKAINQNLRLVVSIAKKYQGMGLPLADLIQEGNIGLMKAVEKYEHEKGSFATYANWWIKQSISRGIAKQGRTIRLPERVLSLITTYNKAKNSGTLELMTEEEIARVKSALEIKCCSLNVTNEDGEEFYQNIEGPCQYSVEEIDKKLLEENICFETKKILTEEEHGIITKYYGINSKKYSFRKIGKMYNLTGEGVRQKKERILKKMNNSEQLKDTYSLIE